MMANETDNMCVRSHEENVSNFISKPIIEQIEEMRTKLKILDGDSKAYYEASYRAIRELRDHAFYLKNEVKELRKDLLERIDTSVFVMDQAFQKHKENLGKLTNLTSLQALEEMDNEVSSKLRQLNAMRHKTKLKANRMVTVEEELQMWQFRSDEKMSGQDVEQRDVQDARYNENKIEKITIKLKETVNIRRTYQAIRQKLLEEQSTYTSTIGLLEMEVKRHNKKLSEIKLLYQDAKAQLKQAKAELKRHDEVAYANRKRRELEILNMRRALEIQHREVVQQPTTIMDDHIAKFDAEANENSSDGTTLTEGQCQLDHLEQIFNRLKKLTGIVDIDGLLARISDQKDIYERLEKLNEQSEIQLESLLKAKESLKQAYEELRAASENKLSQDKNVQQMRADQQQKSDELFVLENKIESMMFMETKIRMCYESIYGKLLIIKPEHKSFREQGDAVQNTIPEEDIHEIHSSILLLLTRLLDDIEDYDFDDEDIKRNEEQDEYLMDTKYFLTLMETKVPQNNTRCRIIEKPIYQEDELLENMDTKSRSDIKAQSRLIITSNKRQKSNK